MLKLTRINNSILLENSKGNISLRFNEFRAYKKYSIESMSFNNLKDALNWLNK